MAVLSVPVVFLLRAIDSLGGSAARWNPRLRHSFTSSRLQGLLTTCGAGVLVFKPGAHLLQARSKRFNLFLLVRELGLNTRFMVPFFPRSGLHFCECGFRKEAREPSGERSPPPDSDPFSAAEL